jgi:hypothetical protein
MNPESESESYITTDGESASLSWNKAPIWGLRPDFYFCQAVAGLFVWSALSDERTALPFSFAAGPRQRSHFRVWDPWDSWPYFTLSDSRLPSVSSPTPRRATVALFDPARDCTKYTSPLYNFGEDQILVSTSKSSSLILFLSVATETCLASSCLAMGYFDFQASCHSTCSSGLLALWNQMVTLRATCCNI